ncbi:cutinase family protein [Leifsonia sp. ZF2019]|uniref:cutinase family protein n=1 Tax=Leifsonia sp. ZF2019 TaxID=2781978 RepID=UPI001CBB2CEC|nr:cutinase family protein [Leifsonia sp. ZF2019]
MVAVRGTSEPAGTGLSNGGRTYASGGVGSTVGQIVGYANREPNVPIYTEGLVYPAAVYEDPGTTYISSVNEGITNLHAEIENLASTCPSTNILLAGYSQGAHVIDAVLSKDHPPAFPVAPLSTNARAHIKAVALVASPTFRSGQPWNAAGSGTLDGMFPDPSGSLSDWTALQWNSDYSGQTYQPIVRSWCFAGDAFCQGMWPEGMDIHASYASSEVPMDAWLFIKSWITTDDKKKLVP